MRCSMVNPKRMESKERAGPDFWRPLLAIFFVWQQAVRGESVPTYSSKFEEMRYGFLRCSDQYKMWTDTPASLSARGGSYFAVNWDFSWCWLFRPQRSVKSDNINSRNGLDIPFLGALSYRRNAVVVKTAQQARFSPMHSYADPGSPIPPRRQALPGPSGRDCFVLFWIFR